MKMFSNKIIPQVNTQTLQFIKSLKPFWEHISFTGPYRKDCKYLIFELRRAYINITEYFFSSFIGRKNTFRQYAPKMKLESSKLKKPACINEFG